MRKISVAVFGVIMLGLAAQSAQAQCSFDEPIKAKGTKSSFVRAYAVCGGGITFPSTNTSTMAGVPGCTPPFPLSPFFFANDKSGCSFKSTQKFEDPCTDGSGIPCANLKISSKCDGVLNTDNSTPTSLPGWAMNTVARATFDDNTSGDMTVINFPAQFAFPQASGGSFKLKSSTNELLETLFGPGSALPGCTAIQLISVAIADPNGSIFAVLGSSTR
jgi:hypothetical protein